MRRFKKILALTVSVAFLLPSIVLGNDSNGESKAVLLKTESRLASPLRSGQDQMEADIAVGQIVKIDIASLAKIQKGDLVTLEIGGETLTAETTAIEASEYPFPRITWTGKVAMSAESEFSIIALTLVEGKLSGTIDTSLRRWQIRPTENPGEGIIEETTNAIIMNERDTDDAIVPPTKGDVYRDNQNQQNNSELEMDLPTNTYQQADTATGQFYYVDMLAVYTTDLKNRLGGEVNTKAEIQNKVDVMNAILRNSGINAAVRIVGFKEVTLPDDTKMGYALADMAEAKNQFADINKWMDSVNADIASLFVRFYKTSPACGLGFVSTNLKELTSDEPNYVNARKISLKSVVALGEVREGTIVYKCMPDTLAHEVGHNLGGHHSHDAFISAGGDPNRDAILPYAFGYCAENRSYGTVMSYCWPHVYYYSDDRVVDGKRIGNQNARNTEVFKIVIPGVSRTRNGNTPQPPENRITVSGLVVDTSGRGVANIKISAVNQQGSTVNIATTDTSGKWMLSLPSGTYTLIPSVPSYMTGSVEPSSLTVSSNQSNIRFTFKQKIVFSGKVVDAQNNPMSNITVQIAYYGQTRPLQSVKTNSNGEWKFEVDPGRKYFISVVPDRYLYDVSPSGFTASSSYSGIIFKLIMKPFKVTINVAPSIVSKMASYTTFQWQFSPPGAPYGWVLTIKKSTGQVAYTATGTVGPSSRPITVRYNVPIAGKLSAGTYTAQVCINKTNVCSNVVEFTVR